jgi:putative peptide zinc metalloprotease protein
MSKYTPDMHVKVCGFARREEGDTVTIGDMDRQVFLTIPTEALVILDGLAEGSTVAEAADEYQSRYGEVPDIEDFLEALESAGFVSIATAGELGRPASTGAVPQVGWLTPSRARRLSQPAVIVACGVLVAVAAVLVATDPATVPGPDVLVFKHHLAAISAAMFAFAMAGVAIHELAHLTAARAAGVQARIGLSHRLWIVVAETDMSGIWLAPKRARYLAFLAGPLVDAASAAILVAAIWARRHGLISLTPFEAQIVGACLLLYLLRLLWQCFFFVRTDFYFVVAAACNCKNLLVDTQDFLHNRFARVTRSQRIIDQSAVPAAEMRIVRWYSLVWLIGRAAAFFSLFVVTLPVMWRYGVALAPVLVGRHSSYSLLDAVVFGVLTISLEGAGLVMWGRSLIRRVIERTPNTEGKSDAMANA